MPVNIKRAYQRAGPQDGIRILVDALWPRGVKQAELKVTTWEKDIAPSKALRTWYGHDPRKWPEFRKRYREELRQAAREQILAKLTSLAQQENLTLVFGARDAEHSNAAVIAEIIRENLKSA